MTRDNPEHRIHRRAVAELRAAFWDRYGMERRACPFFHCPNEGDLPVQYRSKLADLGLSPGVSDLVICWPTSPTVGTFGAALEIKAPKGRPSETQLAWLGHWKRTGFATAVTRGHAATADQLATWGYIPGFAAEAWIAWASVRDRIAL
jgi:hypothetical protein